VVTGDARLALEAELLRSGPQGFDVLAVDAFSSDSIPVHLLTVEALTLYFNTSARRDSGVARKQSLSRSGPVVARLARSSTSATGHRNGRARSRVVGHMGAAVACARHPGNSAIAGAAVTQQPLAAPLWRDDFSNLFRHCV